MDNFYNKMKLSLKSMWIKINEESKIYQVCREGNNGETERLENREPQIANRYLLKSESGQLEIIS